MHDGPKSPPGPRSGMIRQMRYGTKLRVFMLPAVVACDIGLYY